MSFNKKYLPDPESLIKIRETYSSDREFLETYFRKVDSILGSPESFEYIQKLRKKVEDDDQKLGE